MFKVGDLVAEDYRPYWYYGLDDYYYGYGYHSGDDDYWSKPPTAKEIVGIVVEVTTREPYHMSDYSVNPRNLYRVKWLNSPYGDWRDWRYFYESELKLLSSVEDNKE